MCYSNFQTLVIVSSMNRDCKSTRPIRVVLTGVENSGKSTLIKPLAKKLNWPYILELCRENEDVLNGNETFETLLNLHKLNESRVHELRVNTKSMGILCDTGPVVLDFWSKSVFGESIFNYDHEITKIEVDLYLLCSTIEEWEMDPIRVIPDYNTRVQIHRRFRGRLQELNLPFIEVPVMSTSERVEFIEREIKKRFHV
ncbi:MAG: hypothetical protein COA49_04500 [Bacteroidetes bacterium]|nr:MAG: hypothetical protein COA49_04500 [Bacteroidota bacterium]